MKIIDIKKGWVLLLTLGLSIGLFAQYDPDYAGSSYKQHQIQLLLGNSTAVGDYAETDASIEGAGFAQEGFFFGLTYHYQFHEMFAATFAYQGSGMSVDAQAFANEVAVLPGYNYLVEAESYVNAYLLFGGKLIAGDRVKFFVNPSIGTAAVLVPQITTTIDNGLQSARVVQRESTTSGFAFALGLGVEFPLGDLVSFSMNYQYLGATAEVDAEAQTLNFNGTTTVTSSTYDQPINTSTISAGIGFNF